MGLIQNLTQVKTSLATGGAAVGSTAGAFGKAVGSYVCALYDAHPDWVTGKNVDATGFFSNVRTSFLNEVCGPPPPSPPPPGSFPGGQCPICYNVNIRWTWTSLGQAQGTSYTAFNLWGPIQGVRDTQGGGQGGQQQVLCYGGCGGVRTASPIWVQVSGHSDDRDNNAVAITSVSPAVAGQADNCGNLPAPPPAPPPPADFIKNYNIDIVNNDAPVYNLTIPFAFVNFAPSLDIPINFDIDLNVGGQRITLDFGPEGVKLPDSQPSGPPSPTTNRRFDDFTRRIDDVRRRTEECCATTNPPKPNTDYDVSPKTPEDPKTEADIKLLAYVEVLLTKKPTNARQQSGNATAPNVVYAGWFEFKRGNYSFPRSPLHFDASVFKAPIGADGYAYTLYIGFEAKHTVYMFKREQI